MKKQFFNSMRVILAALLCMTILLSTQVAIAQTNEQKESITLSPAINKPSVASGTRINGKLTVINDGETDYRFLIYARPYSVKTENYDPNYTEVNDRTEAYQWVQFEKTDLNLTAGERVTIPYVITVPKNAQAGGHYAVLFAETQPPEAEGTQVARKKRVGSLVYLTVEGDLNNSGSLASWRADLWQKERPVTSDIRIKNDGNVHFQANTSVKYANIFGKTVLTLNQEHFILPGTTRKIVANLVSSSPVGIYKVSGTAKFLEKTQELPSKWIVLLPLSVVYVALGVIALAVGWFIVKPRLKSRKSGGVVRRGKK